MKEYLIDLVVYSREKTCDKCDLFGRIHEEHNTKTYTLREFVRNADGSVISLNRCVAESQAFLPEKFKLGIPTPGNDNDCNGPHFILKDHFLDIIAPVNDESPYVDDFDDIDGASCSNECSSSIPPTDYNLIEVEVEVDLLK